MAKIPLDKIVRPDDKPGYKLDEGKLRMDLLSPQALQGLAAILTKAAAKGKYPARNWEKGMLYERVYAGIMRHLLSWQGGEDIDPDSGQPHIDHAAAGIHFLSHYDKGDYSKFDDRPSSNVKLPDLPLDSQVRIGDVTKCLCDNIEHPGFVYCVPYLCPSYHPDQPCKYRVK